MAKTKAKATATVAVDIDPTFGSAGQYLRDYSMEMANRCAATLGSCFDPEKDTLDAGILSLADEEQYRPYQAQAVAIQGIIEGFRTDSVVKLVGEMGTGKASSNAAKVLTPLGWKCMGDVRIGDTLINPGGGTTRVVGVFPQGDQDLFRVTFSDGASTVTTGDHLWRVNTPLRRWRGRPDKVLALNAIATRLVDVNGNRQHFIPMIAPAQFEPSNLPIDPWLLGYLLGNGCLVRDVRFSTQDREAVDMVTAAIECWPELRITPKPDTYDFRIGADRGVGNALLDALRDEELIGHKAETKFVPHKYLWASIADRLELLRGLCDSDGHATGSSGSRGSGMASNVEYSTVSDRLADDVIFLVQSLGGTVARCVKESPKYTYEGEVRYGQPAHRLLLSLPTGINPFRIARKAGSYAGPTKYGPSRSIVSVDPVERGPATCIAVDHPDQLYVTDDFIVTHNTPIGLWVAKVLAAGIAEPIRIAVSCPNQLVEKWARHARSIIPGCNVEIVRNFKSVLALRPWNQTHAGPGARFAPGTPKVPEVWIFPRDRTKLGYAWAPSACRKEITILMEPMEHTFTGMRWKKGSWGRRYRIESRITCPRCGTVQSKKEKSQGIGQSGLYADVAVDASYFEKRTKRVCCGFRERPDGRRIPCGEPLWQAHGGRRFIDDRDHRHAHGTRGTVGYPFEKPAISPRRIAPCEIVHRYSGKYFHLYIADEVHELKGETLQGQMFADLVGGADRVLLMTGTLTGGYADNLLYLLWRTKPSELLKRGIEWGAQGNDDFVRKYGVLQETRKWISDPFAPNHVLGRGRPNSVRAKSLPGIAPTTFTDFLLRRTVFIRLMEMSDHLPPFEERLNLVRLEQSQATGLLQMSADFEAHRDRMKGMGLPVRAWSGARSVFMRWADKPRSGTVWDYDKNRLPIKAFDYPALSLEREYPKLRRLRRRLCIDKRRRIKSWVFTNMTGPAWDVTEHMVRYLTGFGLKVSVLRTEADGGPNPMEREEWIANHEKVSDVIISNAELVKTGLDLYAFTAIHFYLCGESTYTLRQAARRHWRLGQLNKCRVDYYCYSNGIGSQPRTDARPNPDPKVLEPYSCIQTASMALMSRKLAASLSLEGDFDENGLAALVGDGEDVASKLAKIIAGEIAPDAKAEFAEYRRRLEKSMPNLGAALPVSPPEPEPAPDPIPSINGDPEAIAFHEAEKGDEVSIAVKAWEGTPLGAAFVQAPGPKDTPKAILTPKVEVEAPKPAIASRYITNERELLESIVGRQAGADVRGCLHFGKTWIALFVAPPQGVKQADLRARMPMLRMLDKDGVLVFCVKGSDAKGIGDCEGGIIGESRHAVTAISLVDWDKGVRVGSCAPIYRLRESE